MKIKFFKKKNTEIERLTLLNELLSINLINNNIYDIAEEINIKIYNFYQIDSSSLYLYNKKRQTYSLLHSTKQKSLSETFEGIVEQSTSTNVVILNYNNPVKSEMYFPMIIDKQIVGMILLENYKQRYFSDFDLKFFYIIQKNISLIIQNKLYMDHIKKLALTDNLTGAYNRNFLSEFVKREFEHNLKQRIHGCVVMFDIDYFKRYNDTYGHDHGDKVLKNVSKIAQNNIRNTDTIIRYGGEEFLLFIPGIDINTCYDHIEKIRKEIQKIDVTCSFGISSYPDHATDLDLLIKQADLALYQSKNNGRNRTTIYSKEMG